MVVINPAWNIEFLYLVVFAFFSDTNVVPLLILHRLDFELLLNVVVQKLPLIVHVLKNSPTNYL